MRKITLLISLSFALVLCGCAAPGGPGADQKAGTNRNNTPTTSGGY